MKNYKSLLNNIMRYGHDRPSRAGWTRALFGQQLEWDLTKGFPAITVKKLYFKSVAAELAGFLRAEQNAANMGSDIWLEDAKRWYNERNTASQHETDMGRVYGVQWRQWEYYGIKWDQLRSVVERLKQDPYDRRLLVSAWNPPELRLGCLPPCHYAFQFFTRDEKLSCLFVMRSVDCFLGLPFDIASYGLLTHIVAQQVGMTPDRLIGQFADTHIYTGHIEHVNEVLRREPYPPPQLKLDPEATIDNFTVDMAELVNYQSHPAIKATLYVGN